VIWRRIPVSSAEMAFAVFAIGLAWYGPALGGDAHSWPDAWRFERHRTETKAPETRATLHTPPTESAEGGVVAADVDRREGTRPLVLIEDAVAAPAQTSAREALAKAGFDVVVVESANQGCEPMAQGLQVTSGGAEVAATPVSFAPPPPK
jgi:hypothetical protein